MQPYDVLNLGLVVVDIPIKLPVDTLDFSLDTIRIEDMQMIPGGDAANSSIALRQLGKNVSLTAAVGDDTFGDYLLAEFARLGIDTSHISTKPGVITGVALVLVNNAGERTCVCTRGNNRELSVADFDRSLFASGARHINVSSLFGHPKLEQGGLAGLLAQAREAGLVTSADVGHDRNRRGFPWVKEIIGQLDYFFPSYEQAVLLTGERDPKRQAAFIASHTGERTVIIKMGGEGCFVHEPSGKEYMIPAFKADAVDTTGAGDTFVAAMISALLDGMDIAQSARYANAAAAINVGHIGSVSPDITPQNIQKLLGQSSL
ncbi:MAG: carbohydrate kinase family protein [Christensenellaceae bacterium]|jgi:sugar/nucleoside kinase (ribokinase family)